MSDPRPIILVLFHYFGGEGTTGPTQSILNMISALSGRYRFRVIAEALPGEEPDRWADYEGVERLPLATTRFGVPGLRKAIRETPHDLLLASSFFDPRFTIFPLMLRKLGLIRRGPMLVSPRGEFSSGALTFSQGRKKAYIATARAIDLLDGVALQATSPAEADAIRSRLPFFSGKVCLVPNIRTLPPLPPHQTRAPGEPLRIAFLSRIDKMKNLHFALEVLAAADVPVKFNIFGPVHSTGEEYWRFCQSRFAALPNRVDVVHHGAVPPAKVVSTLARQDLFFLPTLGENFGHAIVDALLAGTPVLLSDRTPWRGFAAKGAGWDLPLEDKAAFIAAIRSFGGLGPDAELRMRQAARAYIEEKLDPEAATEMAAAAFDSLIGERPPVRQRHEESAPA